MNRSNILAVAALVVSAVSTVSAPAFAADLPTAAVHYEDLSLKTADGAKMLKARVERAARHVCDTNGTVDLKARSDAANCARVAVANAMPQVELALANAQHSQVAENSRVSVSAAR
jgi:UrcA family protein